MKTSGLFSFVLLSSMSLCELTMVGCSGKLSEADSEVKGEELSTNIAWQDSQARFTVISDGVIRMEYDQEGQFTDNQSFIATNRQYPKANFTVKETEQLVLISTSKMCLSYLKGSGRFSADNLAIQTDSALINGFTWHPGDTPKNNLGGTYRTLDGYDGSKYYSWDHNKPGQGQELPLEDGILTRDGWILLDDSNGLLFDGDVNDLTSAELPWVKERKEGSIDWYFMAYGHDYKQALNDYTLFAGRIPLPPRYVFGYWWSRYWSYSDAEMRQVVKDFQEYNIPLDVLVVDMDWHWVEPGKGGWTGYTWNDRLFPSPEKFLQYLKQKNLKITLNLHPADGIPTYEDKYAQLATYLGLDTLSNETIPYEGSNPRFMRGWLDKILLPLQNQGVDFWWLDWQQQLNDNRIPSLSNTWWINYCVFDNQRRTQPDHRPMLYHRWGGLGNHRYQIGFSGDTYSTWASLAYQPYFNATSSNVGYGYWSHDLGGHMFASSGETLDRELYTRWMQLGTYLPVMRSHSTKNANMKKEPWNLGAEFQAAVTASIRQRYKLAPYIYTAAREAYDTGVSLCRPLYYDYPEADEAYSIEFRNQYMFGSQILVAPITEPMKNGTSTIKVWLPEGQWFETATGTLINGGQIVERRFLIDEYPIYIKAGSIVPKTGTAIKNLASCSDKICLDIYPGSVECEAQLYEDNGNDRDYDKQYAVTSFKTRYEGHNQSLTLSSRNGKYDGMPIRRSYSVKVYGVPAPTEILLDGKALDYSYITEELAILIEIGEPDPDYEHTLLITYPEDIPELNNGLVGQFRRMKNAMTQMKYRDAGINFCEGLGEMGSICEALHYYPEQFALRIKKFQENYSLLPELLDKQGMNAENKQIFMNNVVY